MLIITKLTKIRKEISDRVNIGNIYINLLIKEYKVLVKWYININIITL